MNDELRKQKIWNFVKKADFVPPKTSAGKIS
jgi:hypothetical protein